MARSRTKMVKALGDSPPPESKVGKVKAKLKNNQGPVKKRAVPGEKPKPPPRLPPNAIENFDTASLGQLQQRYEEEMKKPGGPFTPVARKLRAAMNRAEEAEGDGLSQAQQLEITGKAIPKRRLSMSDRVRRKIVDVVEANLDSSVPKFQLRAAQIGAGLIRIEQADDHHAAGEKPQGHLHVHATMAEMRQQVQADANYQDYLRSKGLTNEQTELSCGDDANGRAIDVEATPNEPDGVNSEHGQPGPVCQTGEQRPLEDAAPPGVPGPGHNGHHSNGRPLVG